MRLLPLITLTLIAAHAGYAQTPPVIEHRITPVQGMRYTLSRPIGWKAGAAYPVVVVIADAEREFAKVMQGYVDARGKRPYVIVVPQVVTAGSPSRSLSEVAKFEYTREEWPRVRRMSDCGFDAAGITDLIADVRRLDAGTGKFYLTGFEAGGHVVLAQLFKHPTNWSAIAAISPNYIGRCMEDRKFAKAPADSGPPVRLFYGAADTAGAPGGVLYSQWVVVQRIAAREGLGHLSEKAVAGQPRGPMPVQVLAWFDSVRAAGH